MSYRAYCEVIAAGIQVLRPYAEVTTTSLERLPLDVARLGPQGVITSPHKPATLSPGVTWVMVPVDLPGKTEVSRGERPWTTYEATLGTLLAIIDGDPRRTVAYGGGGQAGTQFV